MALPTLHITFTSWGGQQLREALGRAGRRERVASLADDLSIGPINPPNPTLRARWITSELGRAYWLGARWKAGLFWSKVIAYPGRRVVWMSRRSSSEYAGFLEFVWRLGDGACEIVDLTDADISVFDHEGGVVARPLANCLQAMGADAMLANAVWDLAVPLDTTMREGYRSLWATLRAEKAVLRVVDADLTMRSAPLSFFDEMLFERVTQRYGKCARIIGQVMMHYWKTHPCPYQADTTLLAARLRALRDAGRIESQGDMRKIGFSEVRLAKSA